MGRFFSAVGLIGVLLLIVWGGVLISTNKKSRVSDNNSNFTIHTIGKHEYIVYHCYNAGGLCHKEDCKFCEEKDTGK